MHRNAASVTQKRILDREIPWFSLRKSCSTDNGIRYLTDSGIRIRIRSWGGVEMPWSSLGKSFSGWFHDAGYGVASTFV